MERGKTKTEQQRNRSEEEDRGKAITTMKLSGGDENKDKNGDLAETKIKTLVGRNKDGEMKELQRYFLKKN
jgi:hypothetical protein